MYDARYIRSTGLNSKNEDILSEFLRKKLGIDNKDVDIIKTYLEARSKEVKGKDTFGVVYDITQLCNLSCIHCCVNAKLVTNKKEKINFETTYKQVCTIIDRISDYIKNKKIKEYFLMFGGGEPFLRPDFPDILQYASKVLGHKHVGFNTNGTLVSLDDIKSIRHTVSIVEISIDGFEEHHNKWRDPYHLLQISNPFRASFQLAKQLVSESDLARLIEVSSIATKDNIKQLPEFMRYLFENCIKTASIHRAMPVGRMGNIVDKVPNTYEYAHLLLGIAKLRNDCPELKLHIHHSLESIYSVLLLGNDIHMSKALMGSKRHSIGIDWEGNVFFDPWCVVPPYNKLCAGNILGKDLKEIIENPKSPIHIADSLIKKNVRCKQCRFPCNGGMRLNALADYIGKLTKIRGKISIAHLITGLSQLDPACPLHSDTNSKRQAITN